MALTNSVKWLALKWSIPTAIIGTMMFVGSIHSGGGVFYISMFFMPPLYLLYIGLWPADNLFVSFVPLLFLHYIMWFLIMLVWKSIYRKDNALFKKTKI